MNGSWLTYVCACALYTGASFGAMNMAAPLLGPSNDDRDGDGAVATLDCDDRNPSVHPGALEQCDGIDANCDGNADHDIGMEDLDGSRLRVCTRGLVRLAFVDDAPSPAR